MGLEELRPHSRSETFSPCAPERTEATGRDPRIFDDGLTVSGRIG
jgi:hypothetical protein